MKVLVGIAALAVAGAASAQFKCTGADGRISFQQTPCERGAKAAPLELKPVPRSAEPSASEATPDWKRRDEVALQQYAAERRVRELEAEISGLEAAIASRNAGTEAEISRLRNAKGRANNNLAGATWEQSLSSEMQAIATRNDSANKLDLDRLAQRRRELKEARVAASKNSPR
ncbi:MAG: DUF4124 domain-containing protein [Comamonadaceae bacterium]|jgi:multidrug resistance efflux pump|nr:DUF4124 domain-containing protein [Comamonadaceae bacterium]